MNDINNGLRPCMVDEKQKGFFHCWEEKSEPVPASASLGGAPAGQLSYTLAIIELKDGSVIECYPHKVRFLDRIDSGDSQKKVKKGINHVQPQRWAPESEIEEACQWITKTVKPSKWPCGADGEKACDTFCEKCWKQWKERET